jgi:transposase
MRQDKRGWDYRKAVKERGARLLQLERRQSKALLRDRMRFPRLLKSAECSSQAAAGRQIGLKRHASEKLWRKYGTEGLAGLLTYPFKGSTGKRSAEQEHLLEGELPQRSDTKPSGGLQVCGKDLFGVSYTPSAIHYVFRRLRVKRKTARPTHVHKDIEGEKRFKKRLSPPEAALQKAQLPRR